MHLQVQTCADTVHRKYGGVRACHACTCCTTRSICFTHKRRVPKEGVQRQDHPDTMSSNSCPTVASASAMAVTCLLPPCVSCTHLKQVHHLCCWCSRHACKSEPASPPYHSLLESCCCMHAGRQSHFWGCSLTLLQAQAKVALTAAAAPLLLWRRGHLCTRCSCMWCSMLSALRGGQAGQVLLQVLLQQLLKQT